MMIPSISLTEEMVGEDRVYTATCIRDGEILSKREILSPQMQERIPAEVRTRVSLRHVAHTLLEKLLEELT